MVAVPSPSEPLPAADILAIHELLARYGHLIDEREFSRLDEVFTADVRVDFSDFGSPICTSAAQIIDQMERSDQHPLAHHATNILVDRRADGTIGVLSKGIGVGWRGRTGTVVYVDTAVKTDEGWRLSDRTATQRRSARS